MRGWLIAASAAVSVIACSATADTYRFEVIDPDARINNLPLANNSYTFFLSSMPTPIAGSATPLYFVVPATDYFAAATAPGVGDARDDRIAFFSGAFFGGLQTMFNQYEGERLFDGTTDQPTFRTGTFTLKNGRSGASLTISAVSGVPGVPEPATWAMMVAGLGAVGATLRVRGAAARPAALARHATPL